LLALLLCVTFYYLLLSPGSIKLTSEHTETLLINEYSSDRALFLTLTERFLELHPYNESAGYQCLQIAKGFKDAASEFGLYPTIVLGCEDETKKVCHAWLDFKGTEAYGTRQEYPIRLTPETEDYFLNEVQNG